MKRGGPLRSRSPRQREHYAAVAAACAAAVERDRGVCQARRLVPEVRCWGPIDPQHLIPQGVQRSLADVPENIVACCRGHHEWVGDHPLAARELGLHGRYGDDLDELAARRHRG